jgi:hypothetical protein
MDGREVDRRREVDDPVHDRDLLDRPGHGRGVCELPRLVDTELGGNVSVRDVGDHVVHRLPIADTTVQRKRDRAARMLDRARDEQVIRPWDAAAAAVR